MPSLVEILKRSNAAFGTNSASLDVSLQSMADGFASFLALPVQLPFRIRLVQPRKWVDPLGQVV
jgi:hypothetical protein